MEIATANQLLLIVVLILGLFVGSLLTYIIINLNRSVDVDEMRKQRIQEQLDSFQLGRISVLNGVDNILKQQSKNKQQNADGSN